MARRRRRRRRRKQNKKASVSQVKAIVKKEVNKTREQLRMVNYVGWSRFQDILATSDPTSDGDECCVYSLTGGLDPLLENTQNPTNYQCKNLFTLLPNNESAGTLAGVGQYGDGGTAGQMDGLGNTTGAVGLSNLHILEGNECYLKNFYASIAFNNQTESTDSPTNMFVRCLVIETHRPLGRDQLSQQILLQNHAVPARNNVVSPGNYPTTAISYLNRQVIKKVYYDKLITLNGGAGATGSMRTIKMKIPINKKAKWKYYYDTRDPVMVDEKLNYQSPFLYLIMWPSASGVYGASWTPIAQARLPAFTLSSILTFYDD